MTFDSMERRSPKSHMVKMPMAKSPVARSPMPKSPMPMSPVPRSPVAYEKYKSRCAYGLISFFHFRHRHSKKMLSDTYSRTPTRHSIEQKKKITTAKVETVQSDIEHAQDQSIKHRKAAKTSRRPQRLPVYGCYDVSTAQRSNSTLQIVAEKDCNSNSNEINLQVNLNKATEAFMNQKLIDGSSHESKHLLDALEVLNSNKDLFVKLLQDPNSLLVKHIEDLRDSQDKEQQKPLQTEFELSENQISSHPRDGDCQPLENIVILKPRLNSFHHCEDTSSPDSPQKCVKPVIFPFEQMKRKLMRAIRVRRKKQQSVLSAPAKPTNGIRVPEQCAEDMVSRNSAEKEACDLGELPKSSSDVSFSKIGIDEDLEMTSKLDSSHDNGVNRCNEMVDTREDSPSLPSPRMDASLETQRSNLSLDNYSSSPSDRCSFKDSDIIMDNTDQLSPISVLDRFFTEDAKNLTNTKSQLARIGTDGLATPQSQVTKNFNSVTSSEEFGSMSNYISKVLQASHFTWDELSQKCRISDQILDLSLFEDIHAGPTQCFRDSRLVFDYVNEVVVEAYIFYLRCSPWLSFIKPEPISMSGDMVHEILEHVDWELLLAHNLEAEKIIEMGLKKSRWMDMRLDVEDIVCEMIGDLLEEMIIGISVE